MSVIIKGMEMPVFEHQSWDIRKGADGKWYMVDTNAETSDGAWHEIAPVPPHGRLGDLDELESRLRLCAKYQDGYRQQGILGACETIRLAPTIIPAEEE